ncbi:MAG: hypothetical protein JHC98_03815 [Thermoleophilaceae bacterium]|nr:hypothetical protein [Thermoleophilaceae bacterium]
MVEDWVWDGSDDLPGGGVTLTLLYFFVPATEEVDLLDDLDRERRQPDWNAIYAEFASTDEGMYEAEGVDDHQAEAHEAVGDAPMSIGQILRMLEHLLGAEILDDSDLGESDEAE